MRAIWTGAITFGLVNIPVRLYSAVGGEALSFDMLHKKDNSPIRYARICKKEEKEVPWEEIVKGYEYVPGTYVVLSPDDFKKANVKKTSTLTIEKFINESEVDPVYFEKPYYLEPAKNAEKAYALLREALSESGKVGLATFVMRNREQLAVLGARGNAIVVYDLRYDNEIRPTMQLELPKRDIIDEKELGLAMSLIKQMSGKFQPRKYKDTYVEELMTVIEKKSRGKKVAPKGEKPVPTRVPDLMATLKKSLEDVK